MIKITLFSPLFFLSTSAPARLKCYHFQIFIFKENDDETSLVLVEAGISHTFLFLTF